MTDQPAPSTEIPAKSGTPVSPTRFALAILTGCVIGWIGYTYPPETWAIPDDMLHIGALSSAEDQARLAAVVSENLWKNTILKFSLAGLGIGLSGLILNGTRRWGSTFLTLIAGPVCGLLAGVIGLYVRRYLNLGYPIPLVSEASRPLFCDSMVFAVNSILLVLPVAVLLRMQPSPLDHHKAYAMPLAGLLAGILVPFFSAFVLPAATSTTTYPPHGIGLTLLWFTALAGLTILLFAVTGSKKEKQPASSETVPAKA